MNLILPTRVKEARKFEYIQYLSPQCHNDVLINQARKILAGKPRNLWVDRENEGWLYRRRIIKDIRCNLMLGWLKKIAKHTPIVLVIRHPLQVVFSWQRLGWGREVRGTRSDFDIITGQQSLLNDFPFISDVMKRINPQDFVEKVVFQWCIFHLIPSQHLNNNEAYTLFYENLLIDPDKEVVRLFQYLNKPFNKDKLREAIRHPSSTNFFKRDINKEKNHLLTGWKNEFSKKQIQRTTHILTAFGLNDIYDRNGYPTGAQFFKE